MASFKKVSQLFLSKDLVVANFWNVKGREKKSNWKLLHRMFQDGQIIFVDLDRKWKKLEEELIESFDFDEMENMFR